MQTEMSLRARALLSGALLALWTVTLLPQAGVVVSAYGNPPGTYTGPSLLLGILLELPRVPGLVVLGVVCVVFRSSCYVGRALGSDNAASLVVLLGNAAVYMLLMYPLAKAIHGNAPAGGERARPFRRGWFVAGVIALSANAALTAWMIWAKKPYYAWPTPVLSVSSLAIGAAAFCSCVITVPDNSSPSVTR